MSKLLYKMYNYDDEIFLAIIITCVCCLYTRASYMYILYSYRIKQIYARIIDQNGGKNRKIVTIFKL